MLSDYALRLTSAYLRHFPAKKTRWRLISHFLPQLRRHGARMGEKLVRTRYGFLYKSDLGDWLGQYVYLTGCYEPSTAQVIAEILKPGDTFIDAGANSGFFTLLASRCVGAHGRVLAFEPVPAMRNRLQMNLALNKTGNVDIHDVALSNTAGESLFHEGPPGHKGLSSLRTLDKEAATFSVKTRPFDELVCDSFTAKLIKVDVEGAEQLVIEGMMGLLTRQKPPLIVEITDSYLAEFGHSAKGLCHKLCDVGYQMYRIEDDGLLHMRPEDADTIPQYNALFTCESPTTLRR